MSLGKGVLWAMLVLLLVSALTPVFNAQPVKAEPGIVYIRADGSVAPRTAPISTVDNVTYTLTDNIHDSVFVQRNNTVIDGAGHTVQGTNAFDSNGIDLNGISNVTLKNMNITAFAYGIHLSSSSNNVVSGNNVINNTAGHSGWGSIVLDSFSSNNTLSGNNVAESDNGIYLLYSSNNIVSGNNITANSIYGVLLSSSYGNNVVSGNNITANSGDGVYLDSSNNVVSGNNIKANSGNGINLGSSNNVVSGNNIANNGNGILFAYCLYNSVTGNNLSSNGFGVYLYAGSINNSVYHNNFFYNTHQVGVNYYFGTVQKNVWDDGYPSGGNYWSDYNGSDANHDGVGDTPYVIDVNNTDRYPLMTIVPEFPPFLILPLFATITLLAAILLRRRKPAQDPDARF